MPSRAANASSRARAARAPSGRQAQPARGGANRRGRAGGGRPLDGGDAGGNRRLGRVRRHLVGGALLGGPVARRRGGQEDVAASSPRSLSDSSPSSGRRSASAFAARPAPRCASPRCSTFRPILSLVAAGEPVALGLAGRRAGGDVGGGDRRRVSGRRVLGRDQPALDVARQQAQRQPLRVPRRGAASASARWPPGPSLRAQRASTSRIANAALRATGRARRRSSPGAPGPASRPAATRGARARPGRSSIWKPSTPGSSAGSIWRARPPSSSSSSSSRPGGRRPRCA